MNGSALLIALSLTTVCCAVDATDDEFIANSLPDSKRSRQERAVVPLTEIQKSEIVNIHNWLRRQEGSSNMELMSWNDYLSSMAADWANGCDFRHGQPARDSRLVPYDQLGQNLYAISGSPLNVTRGVVDWYNEKPDFDYDSLRCPADKMCGHYTQVVWSSSREVGCAYAFCPTLSSTSFRSANYLVCNYGPAGNYVGQKPFKKGSVCSDCASGVGWCADGLCKGDCKSPGPDCECGAKCYNCAKLDKDSCSCQCADGWYGNDCSVLCKDTSANCNASPGWPPQWCNHPAHGKYVREGCPAMCTLCKQVDNVKEGQCQPVGGLHGNISGGTVFEIGLVSTLFAAAIVILTAAR